MKRRAWKWLAALLLVLWCGSFLRAENTEKSVVRAMLLAPPTADASGWTVGLLYQFPEAEADASDAAALVRLCTGTGTTLEEARRQAERELPRSPSYRLCEYALFGSETTLQRVQQVKEALQKEPVRGLSVRAALCQFSPEELIQAAEVSEQLPEQLLQTVKETAASMPCLYESRSGLLLPMFVLQEAKTELAEESVLVTEQGSTRLSSEETQMARLLQGISGEHSFRLEEGTVTFRRCVASVKAVEEGFAVTLTGQRRAGSAPVTPAQCEQLEALCVQTIRRCWEAGYDLLSLGAVRALQQGIDGESLTTKNVCPQLRVDVTFLKF